MGLNCADMEKCDPIAAPCEMAPPKVKTAEVDFSPCYKKRRQYYLARFSLFILLLLIWLFLPWCPFSFQRSYKGLPFLKNPHPPASPQIPAWQSASEASGPKASSESSEDLLLPLTFRPLPLGAITPLGWMNDQMHLMANGLAGHQKEFYHYVNDSSWLGGSSEYSRLNEGFPYWFNGLVPLAYSSGDDRLKSQVHDALDYVLDHQQADGWLGPEKTNATRDLWARFPLFLGFIQLLEVEPSQSARLLPAMYDFISLMHSMLVNELGFLEYWGEVRYQDMMISLQWLYENTSTNETQLLFDTMSLLRQRGRDWADYYSENTYIFGDLDTLRPAVTTWSDTYPWVHGVNAGQSLKAGVVIYRYTRDERELQSTRNAVNWTFTHHGDVAGSIVGDERETGLSPHRGSELCTAIETMYSLSYLYQALGDNEYADRCELAAFNALPVMTTSNQWARQYLVLANQPFSHSITGDVPFFNVGHDGIVYGLEPHYPCCTVNLPQGYPKFLSASFVRAGSDGLAHALLMPASVSTTLSPSNNVNISCNTAYPFSSTFHYTISATTSFNFHIRLPAWSSLSATTLLLNNIHQSIAPDLHTGMISLGVPAGTTSITYTLAPTLRIVPRANNTVAIYHGALLYALDVGESTSTSAATLFTAVNYTRPGFAPYTDPGLRTQDTLPPIPPHAHSYRIANTKPWNIAIDPSSLEYHASPANSQWNNVDLPEQIWARGAPPSFVTGRGCQIEWPLDKGVPAAVPLAVEGRRRCDGPEVQVVLRPYGSLRVHMAELPVVDLGTQEWD